MKLTLLSFFMVLAMSAFTAQSQDLAITEKGDTVYLYSNGTWTYADAAAQAAAEEIPENKEKFKKPSSSGKKMNGTEQIYEVWYDDKVWKRIPPGNINEEAEVALQMSKGEAYGMVIFEKIEIPKESIAKIALDNALSVSPDAKVVSQEYRTVNDEQVVCTRMEGTVNGIKATFYSYYYSNPNGTIQFHTFTGQSLFKSYQKQLDDLLNGLVIKKK